MILIATKEVLIATKEELRLWVLQNGWDYQIDNDGAPIGEIGDRMYMLIYDGVTQIAEVEIIDDDDN